MKTGSNWLPRLRGLLFARAEGVVTNLLLAFGGALLVVSCVVHAHLWYLAYRHVPTLGPLFLVQACSAGVLAVALVVFRRAFLVLAAFGLVAGTIVGFVLVLTVGLFNFKLNFISTEASVALGAESAALVTFGWVALRFWQAAAP
jgi:hypothetical protein